jgi:hypothetical protein
MLQWVTDGATIREGVPFNQGMASLHYTWHFVPKEGVPLFAINQQLGTLNENWFDSYAPYTLLFKSWDFRRFRGPLGDVLYHLEYFFTWLPNAAVGTPNPDSVGGRPRFVAGANMGWNFQLRVNSSAAGTNWLEYDQVVDSQASRRNPYKSTDFANLFRPDQP